MRETLKITRLRSSSYQRSDYLNFEGARLVGIENTQYCYDKVPESGPLVLITNTQLDFDEINQDILSRTQLIIHPNSGFDNIPRSIIQDYDFPIILGNPIRANAVAEYSLSCLFHHMSSVPFQKGWQAGRK